MVVPQPIVAIAKGRGTRLIDYQNSGRSSCDYDRSPLAEKHTDFGLLPDELACWQLIFPQRPVPPLHTFPLPLVHLWHLHSSPLCVKSCFIQIHLQDFPIDIVTDLSICPILSQRVWVALKIEHCKASVSRPKWRHFSRMNRSKACLPAPSPLKKPNFPPSSSRPMIQSLKKSRKAL